ncbi:MAG TPA: potassium channel protein [Bryobacteraceae bacterium]|nr:potassium channel protein [Bryobacteraceae bacterium]HUJ23241.1 potassium channel protein [Bryobacteraceae bacterium]
MNLLLRRLAFIASLIVFTLVMGTVGFTVVEHYPVFDAFYMTLITVSTVGYAEVHPLSHAGRVFNSFLIFFGVTTMFFAIGIMTQSLIELELGEYFEKRRTKRMIEKLENHFIICGYGRVGRNAAHELKRSGVPFVVVDRNPERVENAMIAGMLAVEADSTRDETLRSVGVTRARGLICALSTDADNLFVILSAKNLNPQLRIATRAGEEEAEEKLRRAGAGAVFTPYSTAGYRLAQAVLRPHVFQFFDVATRNMGLDVNIEQVRVTEGSEFASRSLGQTQIRRDVGVIVLAIRKADGQMLFNPPAETIISAGDHLIVMGEPRSLQRLENLMSTAARS